MAIQEHLKDIDFRTRAQRREQAIPDLIEWRSNLRAVLSGKTGLKDSEFNHKFIEGQLQMLNSVLWIIMPESDHRKLVKLK